MWAALIPLIGTIVEKVIPDPQAAADAKLRVMELAQKGELAVLDAEMRLALGQIEVNKAEATTDMFRGGWRPATGWACVFGLVYQFLIQPILPWLVAASGIGKETRWRLGRTLLASLVGLATIHRVVQPDAFVQRRLAPATAVCLVFAQVVQRHHVPATAVAIPALAAVLVATHLQVPSPL